MEIIDQRSIPLRTLYTGAKMPAVGLGTFGSDHADAVQVMEAVRGALKAVLPLCRIKPAAIEMELHPCFQQRELSDYIRAQGIQIVGFCPLGSPVRPERDRTPEDIADLEQPVLRRIAEAHGVHPAVIAVKWAVQNGHTPIPFSVKEKHYIANLKGVTEDPLTEREMQEIRQMECANRLVKGQVFLWPGANDWPDLWDEDGTDRTWEK